MQTVRWERSKRNTGDRATSPRPSVEQRPTEKQVKVTPDKSHYCSPLSSLKGSQWDRSIPSRTTQTHPTPLQLKGGRASLPQWHWPCWPPHGKHHGYYSEHSLEEWGEREESLFIVQIVRALRGKILRRVILKSQLEFWGAWRALSYPLGNSEVRQREAPEWADCFP